jgi:hypothetical protein
MFNEKKMIFGSCCAAHFSPFRLGVAGSDFCSCLDLIPFRRFHLHLFPPVSLRLVHVLASSLIDPSAQFCSPVREIVPSEADSPLPEQTAFRRHVFIFPDRAFLLPSVSGVHFVFYLHQWPATGVRAEIFGLQCSALPDFLLSQFAALLSVSRAPRFPGVLV